ncbi:MAG TPA: ABC transporter ATP-binding protein [Chthonomonadaceae bacterium]|nr:ABC transporter ATP-binding protein [Chthonomonadaceae bacterium]
MDLRIEQLTKTYPSGIRALDGITLTIPSGMFGLLGPNGAGKSTLMRTIATLQDADAGSIRFGGIDVLQDKEFMRRLLGYLPQEFGFYPSLSAEATLDHFAVLKGVHDRRERRERVGALLQQVNLYEVRRKAVGGFSGGMKQRLGIAVALIGAPKLIIVDEPTAGLDPNERHRFLNLLAEVGENVTVILSTHIVEDVRELCERMAILAKGRVVTEGRPEDILAQLADRVWRKTTEKAALPALEANYFLLSKRLYAGRPQVTIYSEMPPGEDFTPVEPDLEDVYFFHIARAAQV